MTFTETDFRGQTFSARQGSPSVDQEVTSKARELMRDERLSYRAALKLALRSNPDLAKRYRAAHERLVEVG